VLDELEENTMLLLNILLLLDDVLGVVTDELPVEGTVSEEELERFPSARKPKNLLPEVKDGAFMARLLIFFKLIELRLELELRRRCSPRSAGDAHDDGAADATGDGRRAEGEVGEEPMTALSEEVARAASGACAPCVADSGWVVCSSTPTSFSFSGQASSVPFASVAVSSVAVTVCSSAARS
jgi:hypothetical protein